MQSLSPLGRVRRAGRKEPAGDDFDIMLAKAVQPQVFAGAQSFPSALTSRVAVTGGPFGDIRVKAFAMAAPPGRAAPGRRDARNSRCSRRPSASRVWASRARGNRGSIACRAAQRAGGGNDRFR